MYLVKMRAIRRFRDDAYSGGSFSARTFDAGDVFITHDERAMRLEAEGHAEEYREQQFSVNELRGMFDLKPIEGGCDVFIQAPEIPPEAKVVAASQNKLAAKKRRKR